MVWKWCYQNKQGWQGIAKCKNNKSKTQRESTPLWAKNSTLHSKCLFVNNDEISESMQNTQLKMLFGTNPLSFCSIFNFKFCLWSEMRLKLYTLNSIIKCFRKNQQSISLKGEWRIATYHSKILGKHRFVKWCWL